MDQRNRINEIKQQVGVSKEELARYRQNLFTAKPASWGLGLWALAFTLIFGCGIIYWAMTPAPPTFPSFESLDAQNQPPDKQKQLLRWAKQSLNKGEPWPAERAHLILALYAPPEMAVEHAIQALNLTHDNDTRILCLEVLVDHGEQFWFEPEWVEQQLDRETHPTCRHLWSALLRLNQS